MKHQHIATACLVSLCLFSPLRALAPLGVNIEVGDLLLANYGGDSVLKINRQTGEQQVLGSFLWPTDLALSPDGQLYVSLLDGTIQRFTLSNGVVSVVNPAKTLTGANGITLGPQGDLYVTAGGNRVVKVDPNTGAETNITQGGNLTSPVGIAFQDPTNLLVTSMLNSAVVIVSLPGGGQTIAPGASGVDFAWGVAAYGGDIFFTRFQDQKAIQRLSGGNMTVAANTRGFPYGLAIETNGNFVVASTEPDAVECFSPQGLLLDTYTGGDIRQITGIEISTIQVTALVPQLQLQSCQSSGGTFVDVPDANWYAEAQSFSVAPPPNDCFYRLRGNYLTRITAVYFSKGLLWLDYEYP